MQISNVEKQFINFIINIKNKLNKNKLSIGILYSGGVDSTVLLHIANKYKNELNLNITILHIVFDDIKDYKIIKKQVDLFSKWYENKLIINYCSIKDLKSGIKEKARNAMKEIALNLEYDIILSGHHANDQIETFLFRLFSRSSLEGLKGMDFLTNYKKNNKNILLGKPFLNIFKKDLYEYSYNNYLIFFEDETNLIDSISNRNYIRNNIIPIIENRFKLNNILNTIELIRENIDTQKRKITNIDIYNGKWNINDFINLPIGNRVFIIREYFSKVHGYNLNKAKINELKNRLEGDLFNLHINIGNKFIIVFENKYIICKYLKLVTESL